MKKFLLQLMLLALCAIGASAQVKDSYNPLNNTKLTRAIVEKTFFFPTGCGVPSGTGSLNSDTSNRAALYFDSCGHRSYVWDPKYKAWIIAGADSSLFATVYRLVRDSGILAGRITDTAAVIRALINTNTLAISGKLNISDTSTMLSGYSRSGQTVKYSDTASMLASRMKYSDTALGLQKRVKYSDTAGILTGYARTGNVVKYTDVGINNGVAGLDPGGKVPFSQLPASLYIYKGTWNASTNTPTLVNGTGTSGWVYQADVAGIVNFGAGNITFAAGDYVGYNGSIWQWSPGTSAVRSVNGQQGVVIVTVTGTSNRITVTGGNGATPTIDIASTYTGQASITTVGTITAGAWNGTPIANANLANSSITLGSTNISLGATASTISGLVSVNSALFNANGAQMNTGGNNSGAVVGVNGNLLMAPSKAINWYSAFSPNVVNAQIVATDAGGGSWKQDLTISTNTATGDATLARRIFIPGGGLSGAYNGVQIDKLIVDATLTVSGLTQRRIPFVSIGGLLKDTTGFTWDGAGLSVPGAMTVNGMITSYNGTSGLIYLQRSATTNNAMIRYDNAGVEKWRAGMIANSTNDYNIADGSGTPFLTIAAGSGAVTLANSITAGAGNFSGNVNIQLPAARLRLTGNSSANSGAYLQLLGWQGGNKNWQITVANNTAGLEFAPSTTGGGSTFGSNVIAFTDAGGITTTDDMIVGNGNSKRIYGGSGLSYIELYNASTGDMTFNSTFNSANILFKIAGSTALQIASDKSFSWGSPTAGLSGTFNGMSNAYWQFVTPSSNSGYLGFGSGLRTGALASTYIVRSDGAIELNAGGNQLGLTINSNQTVVAVSSITATAFYESSDIRYKTILSRTLSPDGFDMISFKWKKYLKRDNLLHFGYGAQEVERIYPDQVITDEKGFKSVNYTEVHTVQISGLQKEVSGLKKRIAQLENKSK